MKKLFLSSAFASVASLFPAFAGEPHTGKTVTFIPTASIREEVTFYVDADKKAFIDLGLIPDELEISTASNEEIFKKITNNDYIFVSGGNTFFLLQELRKTGTDKIIIEQVTLGKPYIGTSAGSVIMSPNIEYIKHMDDIKTAPELIDYSALGLVDIYPVPHVSAPPFKESAEKIILEYGSGLKLYPITNEQVIIVRGNEIKVENT